MKIQSILAALGCAAIASTAQAGVVFDQGSIPESGGYSPGSGTVMSPGQSPTGQSFTVGRDGRLARIDLLMHDPVFSDPIGSLTFWLEDSSGVEVFSTQVDYADIPEFAPDFSQTLQIDLSTAYLTVAAGQQYRMFVAANAGSATWGPAWTYSLASGLFTYDGGDGLVRTIYGDFPTSARIDNGFRTYVNTSVPEPGAWALMIAGFGGVGAALRRRAARFA